MVNVFLGNIGKVYLIILIAILCSQDMKYLLPAILTMYLILKYKVANTSFAWYIRELAVLALGGYIALRIFLIPFAGFPLNLFVLVSTAILPETMSQYFINPFHVSLGFAWTILETKEAYIAHYLLFTILVFIGRVIYVAISRLRRS